jgi:hypothetical protein
MQKKKLQQPFTGFAPLIRGVDPRTSKALITALAKETKRRDFESPFAVAAGPNTTPPSFPSCLPFASRC